jgi:alpha-mannosidase
VGATAAIGALGDLECFAKENSDVAASHRVLHIIGYSHIDAAWMWPWRDGSNLALTTARSALDRMNETPGFRYSHSSAIHYRWIQMADPSMFEEILHRIREGRWEVVGGWPVEPDCNLPSTESFVRHALYGKKYCRQMLGVDVKIGFNPDAFGHAAGLPTILKHSGYNYYVFTRPGEDAANLPLLFWWEGPDGSRLLTLRILHSYTNPASRIPGVAEISFAPGFSHGAFFLGVGDHGGAVTKAQIQEVLRLQNDTSLPELRWSTVSEFFQAIERSPVIANLPVIKGGLQHAERGCYSACGEQKYQNRRSERAMVETESIALLTSLIMDRKYPKQEFEDAWWNILFNQFHDILAGTALYPDYEDARDGLGSACQTAASIKIRSLESLAKRVNTSQASAGVVFVFNPLPWRRKVLLEYVPSKYNPGNVAAPITSLKSQDGNKIPVQLRPSQGMTNLYPRLSALIDLPAFGYKVLSEEFDSPPAAPPFRSFCSTSESSFGLSSLRTDEGVELLASGLGLVVIADGSDTWAQGIDEFRQEIGRPSFLSSTVVEDGPVMRTVRQKLRWKESEIAVDISTFAELDIVRLAFVIDWHQHQQILKLEIPTVLSNATVFAMVPGAVVERRPDGKEEPYQDWVALQGSIKGRSYTLGLMNNSTYSCDCLDNVLRTILIRSAPYTWNSIPDRSNPNAQMPPNNINPWQDQGRQERVFWLVGRPGKCTEQNLDRLANELQMPAEYVMDSKHQGSESWEQSYLEITPGTVALLSMKQREGDSRETILRVQERSGKPTSMRLRSSTLSLNSEIPLLPWELKTLRIRISKQHKSEVSVISALEI